MKFRFKELVDIPALQKLTDELFAATSIPSSIIAMDGQILTGSGWQKICTDFHRQHPQIKRECIESDTKIRKQLDEGEPFVLYRCPRGLVDASSPIIIAGEHVANVFSGQIFLKPPDATVEKFFREQAREFGFEETEYIQAFREIPVFTEKQFRAGLSFIAKLAQLIGEMGVIRLNNLNSTEALRESEEEHHILLDESTDPIFSFSVEGRYLYVNRAFANGVGKSIDQVIGRTIWDVFPRDEADKRFSALRHVFETRAEKIIEVRVPRVDGDLYFITTITPIADEQGNVSIVICSSKDITARKQVEDALRESEQNFRTLSDSGQALIWTAGTDKLCNYFNRVWTEFTGRTRNQEMGNGWTEGVHPDDLNRCLEIYVGAFDRRAKFSMEYRLRRHDGEYRWLLDDGCPRYNSKGEFIGYIGHCLDITERKISEQEQEKLREQLNQAQKMESVGRLAGGVAHDYNNMLGIILGHAELALDQVDPAQPLHADLAEIKKAAQRSASLTRQLLAFARKQTIALKVLDLNETVESMLKMLRRLIGEDINLVWLPGKHLWPVHMDPSQIDQIMVNLCVNARDAIADVGKVTIETQNVSFDAAYCAEQAGFTPGEYVRIAVSDDGCGMDKQTLSHLFEPFFTTKEMGRGTGLGLATLYGIVKQNNGFINVYSEPDQGTTFKIYIPAHKGNAETWAESPAKPDLRGQETILLVEDEPEILKLTTRMLERLNYTVLAASTPFEAMRLAEAHSGKIHLLMTDVVMPEMNGRDLAKNLLFLYPDLQRLFMSGYTADVIAHHGVLDQGVHFIQKPFSKQALAAKVREVLD